MDTKSEQLAKVTEQLAPIGLVLNRLKPNKSAPIRLIARAVVPKDR